MELKYQGKKFFALLIFLILVTNIFSITADELVPIQRPGTETSGTTGGTTTPAGSSDTNKLFPIQRPGKTTPPEQDYSKTNEYHFSVPGDEKKPLDIGQVTTVDDNGKQAKPENVKLGPGRFDNPAHKEGKVVKGGEYKAAGTDKDGKDTPLVDSDGKATPGKGYFESHGNKFKDVADNSQVKINEHGRIEEANVKGIKSEDGKGTEVTIDGRDKKVTMGIPEGAKLTKEPGVDYTLIMGEKGGKLQMPKVEKKKGEEEDPQGYNPRFNIVSQEAFTQMPDELARKAGFASGLSFKTSAEGALIFNSDGTWSTHGTVTFATPGSDGKLLTVKNLGETYNNANKESVLFLGRESAATPEARVMIKEGIAGVVIDANQKFISSFSTNNKIGAYVKLEEGNPFNGYGSAILPEAGGGVSIVGGNNPTVRFQGDGFFYGGEGIGFKKQGNDLFFKEGAKISDIFGNNVESFASSNNYKATVIPLDGAGNYISVEGKRLIVQSGIVDGKITNNAIAVNTEGAPVQPGRTPSQPSAPVQPVQPSALVQPEPVQPPTADPGRVRGNLPSPSPNPASNLNPGAAAPVQGLGAINFPADRDAGGYNGIQGDVLSHAKPGAENQGMTEIGPGGSRTITTRDTDPSTGTHELEHDVNSRLRNEKGQKGYWGFYTGNNQAVYVKEFDKDKVNIETLRKEIPFSLQGNRYKSYIAEDKYGIIKYEDGRTEKFKINDVLTVYDELWAYNMGSKAMIETGRGHITGHSDFATFGLASAKVLSERDPSYWNSADGAQFKAFLGHTLQESMSLLNQGASRADQEQMRILQNLRTSPDAEPLREWARKTYGQDWTKKVFGF